MMKGFSLIELMVGLVVSLILVGMMAVFMGDVSYVFQDQKATIRDRTHLQRNLLIMSRELMEVGYGTKEDDEYDAQIDLNGEYRFFMNVIRDDNGFPVLSYWTTSEDMDFLTSQDEDLVVDWQRVTYRVASYLHPVTQELRQALLKNGAPFILGVSDFSVDIGLDLDDDGLVSDAEWTDQYPEDQAGMLIFYSKLKKIRISIATETRHASKKNENPVVVNRMSQEIFLRNRSTL